MADTETYNRSVDELDFILGTVIEGWDCTDEYLGKRVRECASNLCPAMTVLRCFKPPLDFPAEMQKSDFGRLAAVIHGARRTGLINHDKWFKDCGGFSDLAGSMEGITEGRTARPMIDALIAHAVINFMRLLKEEKAADSRALIDFAAGANAQRRSGNHG